MSNEYGLEGQGVSPTTANGPEVFVPWLAWPPQPLEGVAKGAACWKM
jgi:hypothetical protein